jgi:hypothetical protein
MSYLRDIETLYAAINLAVHAPSAEQPGKVTAPGLNQVLKMLADEVINRGQVSGAGSTVLTAPDGTAFRLRITSAGQLVAGPLDGALDAHAAAFCGAAGITDETQQQALSTLAQVLKTAGLWDRFHALYPMVGGTAKAHALNLKDPRDADEAFRLTFYNTPAHTALGVAWNGSNQYADTHYLPQAHLPLNSTHLAYYVTADDISSVQVEMGCDRDGRYFSLLAYFQGQAYFENSRGGQVAHPVATGLGLSLGTRERADLLAVYREGQQLATASTPSEGFPLLPVLLGCRSLNYYSQKTCGLASIGTGFTAAEAATYSAAVRAFQRALGRDVLR